MRAGCVRVVKIAIVAVRRDIWPMWARLRILKSRNNGPMGVVADGLCDIVNVYAGYLLAYVGYGVDVADLCGEETVAGVLDRLRSFGVVSMIGGSLAR